MNLLQRLFSIGSKKNKKKAKIVHNVPLPEHDLSGLQANNDQEYEAAVGRLLRSSSSARYVETPELDFATLPPLPHPINKVIQTPASSTVSLASTSLSQRGTYNVTIHKRRRHASTEFPHANRDLDDQQKTPNQARVSLLPVEDSRVLRLRSDPSVASLLDLYDEHGKVSSNAFSNSPPNSPVKEGRAQCRRNGSTLRQLLGAPILSSRHENDSGSEEGDISWAEKFLAETESISSASSIHTPNTPRGERERDISFNTDGDLSGNAPENPAISSMEVELSMTTDFSQDLESLNKNSPYMNSNPSTPQRASQVFGFLTRGKQSKPVEEIERSLPELPSAFSSPSDENVPHDKFKSHFSDNSSDFTFVATRFSTMSIPLSDDTSHMSRARSGLFSHPPSSLDTPASQELRSTFSDDSHDPHVSHVPANFVSDPENPLDDVPVLSKQNDIKVIMNGPTKVIVTAPTPSTNREASAGIPRGPRSLPRRSSSSVKRRRSALVELANSTSSSTMDPFTVVPSRRRTQTHRTSSQNSTVSISRKNSDGPTDYISKPIKLISTAPKQKENQPSLTVRQEIPATPLRSNTTGSQSLFRSVVHHGMFQSPVGMTPSPASSSEMSPVGRQMMMDVRQQRLKARETEREKSGKRFGTGRNGLRI